MTSKLYNKYHDGALVRITATFTDLENVPTDPTDVTLRLRGPDDETSTEYTYAGAEVEHDATGVFYRDVDTTDFDEGTWFYKWIGTGAVTAADQWAFIIRHEEA